MSKRVLNYEQALQEVLLHARSLAAPAAERVALQDTAGRVLAAHVTAPRDHPPFHRSTRDGFAIRADEFLYGKALRIVGTLHAGESWARAPLAPGQAIEIMTGAPLPQGADAVVMLEHVVVEGESLRLEAPRKISSGDYVVARGSEARIGDIVLPAGRRISAAEIAVAAACGAAQLAVFAQSKVAIIPTGDELVELNLTLSTPLTEAQIYNSNSHALAALARVEGALPFRLCIARDIREDLQDRMAQGSMFDLLVLSGGVSIGKHDLVEQVLAECGAQFFFTGAEIQPGKPIVFGRLPKSGIVGPLEQKPWKGEWTYFFGLPGNPISTQVCFHLFVAPFLRALAGESKITSSFAEARLTESTRANPALTRFLPAELVSAYDSATVRLVGWQGSGDLAANARANCYCVLPPRIEDFAAGETVRVLLR